MDEHQRRAVADQAIVAAGNIIAAAGFNREEIGEFFRQAADQLAPIAPLARQVAAGPSRPDLAPVHAAFRRLKPVVDLRALIARSLQLLPLDRDGSPLKDCFDLAMQMVPLLAEAQSSLRAMALQASLPLFVTREEWSESGAAAQPAICLEEFETVYRGAFETIGAMLDELLRRDDVEAFTFLVAHLSENGVTVDRGLGTSIEKAATLLP